MTDFGERLVSRSVVCLVGLSCLSFGAALAAPLYSVVPGAGELTPWLRALKPEAMAQFSQSLSGGIQTLWIGGDFELAALLALFCLVLPMFKFIVMWSGFFQAGMEKSFWGKVVSGAAKYSMAEALVLVVLLLVVKGLPGGSTMKIEPAAWFFIGSAILSCVAAVISWACATPRSRQDLR